MTITPCPYPASPDVSPFRRILNPAWFRTWRKGSLWPVFVKVDWDGKRLSLTGVEGPRQKGDAWGSCGQITPNETYTPAEGWTAEMMARLWVIWGEYHLNDLTPGCRHQRETWGDPSEKVELVTYKLTTEAYRERKEILSRITDAALRGVLLELTPEERALAALDDWYKDRPSPPDADSPLSGCFEVSKRETKALGWLRPGEHPRGLLARPCEVCGYKYGTAWLTRPVPLSVLGELQTFPASTLTPAWV